MIIGFERVSYTVLESAGTVRVVVAVLEGQEAFTNNVVDNVEVQLSTQDGTALGRYICIIYRYMYSNISI